MRSGGADWSNLSSIAGARRGASPACMSWKVPDTVGESSFLSLIVLYKVLKGIKNGLCSEMKEKASE
jgi:hypothetical protein